MNEEEREDGWEAHAREQLRGNLLATPEQRLRWLEEAIRFAYRTGTLPKRETPGDRDQPSG